MPQLLNIFSASSSSKALIIGVSEVSFCFFISKFVGELPGEESFSGGEWYPGTPVSSSLLTAVLSGKSRGWPVKIEYSAPGISHFRLLTSEVASVLACEGPMGALEL